MSAVQIAQLLQPAVLDVSQKKAIQTLNATYATFQDVDTLITVVDNARQQRDSIKSSLAASQENVSALISDARSSSASHLRDAQQLSLDRHSLADELSSLSVELVSSMSDSQDAQPTLLEDLETMHRNLKELESIKVYVQIVERALQLSEQAVEEVKTVYPISISTYESLRALVTSVGEACSNTPDDSTQHIRLQSFLEELGVTTWSNMIRSLSTVLLSAAEKLRWPMPVDYFKANAEDRKAFEQAFIKLLDLQIMGDKIHSDERKSEKDVLYAMQALVQPISQRFRYHFEGTRETNRLDKPEWYFTHILNIAHEHRSFMDNVIQKLLSTSPYNEIHAWREFCSNLLTILSRRLRRTVPALLPHPPLLAHTIYQALSFDASLKDEGFSLAGTLAARDQENLNWDGIAEVVLGRKEWFDRWMEGEKAFALGQYNELITASDAWLIADDDSSSSSEDTSTASREVRPTVSARRLKLLVEQVTDRYAPLPQFSQRTRFLINVQLPLLESYHARISSSLDAHESLSSALVRAVPGALGGATGDHRDRGRLTSGVEGVTRLCKALVSAKWISVAMKGWGEDLFFLELWTEINHRASLRVRAETHPSLPDPKEASDDAPEGTIFEELVHQYEKLVTRAEDIITQQVCGEVETSLRSYWSNQQATSSPDPTQTDLPIAPQLLTALSILSSHLTLLRRTLPQNTTTTIYRQIASRLCGHILQRAVLYRGHQTVSPSEGKVLQSECEMWVETCRQALGVSQARVEAPWRRLLETGRIVGAEGKRWEDIVDVAYSAMRQKDWEERMIELIDWTELTRDEVVLVVQTRAD